MGIDLSNIFDSGMDYPSYRELVSNLLANGKTTGDDNSEAMLHYTKMNNQRMNRVEKTTVLTEELLNVISNVKGKYHFLVISEGWCGDAAQIVPVIDKIVQTSPTQFDLKLILRDQHLVLMENYLTNGGRAIPVVLVLDENKQVILPKWGPRPKVLQSLLAEWKKDGHDSGLLAEQIHGWYAKDKTLATQTEFVALLAQLA